MRKMEIKDYMVKQGEIDMPYFVKESIINTLFHPDLKLDHVELLKANKLADKINDCKDDFILLEDEEYNRIKRAIGVVKGLTRHDVKLVEMINNAEIVKVKEE